MQTDQPIIIPIIVALMGLYILIDNKRLTSLYISNKEKHVRGKGLSEFEKAYARVGVFAAGIFGLGIGILITIKTMLGY